MAINANYYIDAASLEFATGVYLNAIRTFVAPDGFYREGTIVRQQSGGILLAVGQCQNCSGSSCAVVTDLDSYQGIYSIDLDEGTATGAIVIKINTNVKPEGVRATYNSIVYNKLVSPVDGRHQSSNYGSFTIVGQISEDCGLTGNNTVYVEIDEYLYDGSTFNLTGNQIDVTVNSSDVKLSANPDDLYMIIPKPAATPSIVNVQIFGLCGGTDFSIETFCPAVLPTFNSSAKGANASIRCDVSKPNTYYYFSVNGNAYVGLYDYIFTDQNGQYPLVNGYYCIDSTVSGSAVINVSNGIVIGITNCI